MSVTASDTSKPNGFLITMVGPAGAGKNQLMNDIIVRHEGQPPTVRQFPTATTRAPRAGEQEGRQHHFVTVERFQQMIERDELLEYQRIHGSGADRYYGMPRATLEAGFLAGEVLIADVEYLGARRAKNLYADQVVTVFIMPPSISALIERMRNRRTDSEREISKRLLRVSDELAFAAECDYVIVNDNLDRAADLLHSIVNAEINRRGVADRLARSLMGKYTYHVQVDVIGGELPLSFDAPLLPHETPFETALHLIQARLDSNADAGQLITGQTAPDDNYLPPVRLAYEQEPDATERILFIYQYPVAALAPEVR